MATLADLITPQRAAQNGAVASAAATNPASVAALVAAASAVVRRYCARDFTLANYSELYSGNTYIREPLRLRQFPVNRISRLATNPVQALLVQNSGATVQRATVETLADGTGVELQYQISGATLATSTLPYATYPTLATLAAAVTAVGNGFTGTVANTAPGINVALCASADLWPTQGAATATNAGAYLTLYVEDATSFGNFPAWGDDAFFFQNLYGWRLDAETGELYGRLPRGQLNVRVDYQAGFAAIPADVQEATAQIVKWLLDGGRANHVLKQAQLGRAMEITGDTQRMPPASILLLSPYRAYDRFINRN